MLEVAKAVAEEPCPVPIDGYRALNSTTAESDWRETPPPPLRPPVRLCGGRGGAAPRAQRPPTHWTDGGPQGGGGAAPAARPRAAARGACWEGRASGLGLPRTRRGGQGAAAPAGRLGQAPVAAVAVDAEGRGVPQRARSTCCGVQWI